MTGKHRGWHKAWQRLPDGRLRHASGVEFTVERGDGFTDISVTPETLDAFRAYEAARGVPIHDMTQRLLRLAREARKFMAHATIGPSVTHCYHFLVDTEREGCTMPTVRCST